MTILAFLIAAVLFVGSFFLFGYAFEAEAIFAGLGWTGFPFEAVMFTLGILSVSAAVFIPWQLLGHSDKH